MRSVLAWETLDTGDGVVLRNSDGLTTISSDPGKLLGRLAFEGSNALRVSWCLDEMIAPILKLLPVDILERLSKRDNHLVFEGLELYYYPQRMFRVNRSFIYSLDSFYHCLPPPNIKNVAEMAYDLVMDFEDMGMPDIRKLTSPIAVFEDSEFGKNVYQGIPKNSDIPAEFQEMVDIAGLADGREWVDTHIVGAFAEGELHDYDLNSAYPSAAADLPDIRDLQYWKSNHLGDRELAATIGMVRGSFWLDPKAQYAHCSPIISRAVNDDKINAVGQLLEDFYTLDDVRFILNNNLGAFSLSSGVFAVPAVSTPRKPFSMIMHMMYEMRDTSKTIAKGIANELIGKLIETRFSGGDGAIPNKVYHALILSRTRIAVAQFLIDHEIQPNELACVQTDGCRLTRLVDPGTGGFGGWKYKGSSPVIIVSPVKVFTLDKRPYSLTYDTLVRLIAEHPRAQSYEYEVNHRITLRRAIELGSIQRVGEIVQMENCLDLLSEQSSQLREFKKLPLTGRDLLTKKYYSTPVIL